MIWWGFFRLISPAAVLVHVGADTLKKPHHITTLWFSEVVNDHHNWILISFFLRKLLLPICSIFYENRKLAKTFQFDLLPFFWLKDDHSLARMVTKEIFQPSLHHSSDHYPDKYFFLTFSVPKWKLLLPKLHYCNNICTLYL